MILKKGLQILKHSSIGNNISELLIFKELPQNYLFFLKNYSLGDYCFDVEKVLFDSVLLNYTFIDHDYFHYKSSQKLHITGFFEIERIKTELNGFLNKENYWHEDGFIEIGYLQNNLLLLNLNDNDKGEICIYKDLYDKESGYFVIAKDILGFMSHFSEIINTEISIDPSDLYKNWHEDFWRIKPPELSTKSEE